MVEATQGLQAERAARSVRRDRVHPVLAIRRTLARFQLSLLRQAARRMRRSLDLDNQRYELLEQLHALSREASAVGVNTREHERVL